jgi:hypothetical protein
VISIHLSDEEITAAAAGERVPRTAHHLQICSECQEQVQKHRETLAELRQDFSYGAARSAIDWGRQSNSIRQRILAAKIRNEASSMGFALVSSAFALALILTIFIGFRDTPTRVFNSPTPTIVSEGSDAALLNDIESRMDEELPDALQPADLLVNEMGGLQNTAENRGSRSQTRSAQ